MKKKIADRFFKVIDYCILNLAYSRAPILKRTKVRIIMTIIGLVISGFAVGLFKYSSFGTDPFQVFVEGLHAKTTMSYGTVYAIVNAVVLIFVFFTGRRYIGFSTVVNLFLIGYLVEFSQSLLGVWFPEPVLYVRMILLVVGFLLLCLGTAFYLTPCMGASPFSAISLIMTDKKIAKFQYCRIFTDVACVIIGFLMGSVIGIGTVISAFAMGPFIAFFMRTVSNPLLDKFV